jgi:uncharacterized protein
VYFGESLGAGVALALALERPPAALILRSPFSSAVDVGRFHYPWLPVGLLLKDRFPSIERVGRIASPMLFIAGERDRIVPASQTRALFDAASGPKELFVLPDADHNDEVLVHGREVVARIVAFVDSRVDR